MSRDPRDPDAAPSGPRDAELLTAYVDGVAELTPEDRHRAQALIDRDPEARADQAAARALIDRLRALPPEGTEPDWTAMERSIRQAVGPELPRPWWRRWTWLAPSTMLVTAAAVMLVMWARPTSTTPTPATPTPIIQSEVRQVTDLPARDPRPAEEVVALWLDGAEVDVDLSASDLLGDLGPGDDDPVAPDADTEPGLLPSTNLAWVDKLDDDALARAERWLARKKG